MFPRVIGAIVLAAFAVLFGAPASAQPLPLVNVVRAQVGDRLEARGLIDQAGRPFSFAQLRGRTTALAFIYTRCRDNAMCPLVSAKFEALQRRIDPKRMALVELTLDPTYDTPPVLARYGEQFAQDPARWSLVGGDLSTLAHLAGAFDLTPTVSNAGIVHGERLIVVDADGRIADVIDGNAWTVDEALADLRSISGISYHPILLALVHATWGVETLCGIAPSGSPLALHHAGFGVVVLPLGIGLIAAFMIETRRRRPASLRSRGRTRRGVR